MMIRYRLLALLALLFVSTFPAQARLRANPAEAAQLSAAAQAASARGDHEQALALYVRAIASDGENAAILRQAGEEALAIGDNDAAFGFLGHSVTLDPRNAQARASYGRALVQVMRPKDALTLFDQAVRLGMKEADIAGDRGLARDLLGENRRAQKDYRLALAAYPGKAVLIERLGLSLAISGEREQALALVRPLAQRTDSGNSWRTLAFIHALSGDLASARKIAEANIPAAMADSYAPFFARLVLMNNKEKAAAVHLGIMPQVRYAREQEAVPLNVTRPDVAPRLLRPGARAEANGDEKDAEKAQTAARDAKPETPVSGPCDDLSGSRKTRCEANERALARRCSGKRPRKTAECIAWQAKGEARQQASPPAEEKKARDDKKPLERAQAAAEPCAGLNGKKAVQCRANRRALERRCSGKKAPDTAECIAFRKAEADGAGADHAKLPDAKADKGRSVETKKEKQADSASPCDGLTGKKAVQCKADARALERRCGGAHPQKTAECEAYAAGQKQDKQDRAAARTVAGATERFWVQLAGGRNKADLPKEWDRLKGKYGRALRGQTPYVASSGATNRLLVGPFASKDKARDLVNKLDAGGLATFPWTSSAGEDVDPLK